MTTSLGRFLIRDNLSTIYFKYEGSFNLPLKGSGAKYGESVSTNKFSIGIEATASVSFVEFLKVIIPLIEI